MPFATLLGPVLACAVCGAAERSLPTNGAEVAFEGRKRATVDVRAASFATRARDLRLTELRVEPGLAVAVLPTTLLAVEVPLLHRSLALGEPGPAGAPFRASGASGATDTAASERAYAALGDVDVRVSHTAFRSAPAPLSRRLLVTLGVKLPTAPLERDPGGDQVHPDLQPGCGSVVPNVGVAHRWSRSVWSATTSVSFLFPVSVREGAHPGDSLRASVVLEAQPTRAFATRLGVAGRFDGTGEIDDEVVKRSGGAALYVAPEIVVSPVTDVVLSVGASFPAVQAMRGYRATSPVLLASVGVDF